MYRFINATTRENFLSYCEENKLSVNKLNNCAWEISDKYSNKWTVYFTGMGQYTIYSTDMLFWVEIQCEGKDIKVLRAVHNGRNLTSERMLKKFGRLAMMVSCFEFWFHELVSNNSERKVSKW